MRDANALDDDTSLDEIKQRAAAATPGPWVWDDGKLCREGHTGAMAPRVLMAPPMETWNPDVMVSPADAAFIAAARTDVPALVTAVREARRAAELVAAGHAVKVNASTVVVVCAGDEFLPAARELAKVVGALDAAREARTAADRRADEAQRQLATLVAERNQLGEERERLRTLIIRAKLVADYVGRVPSSEGHERARRLEADIDAYLHEVVDA